MAAHPNASRGIQCRRAPGCQTARQPNSSRFAALGSRSGSQARRNPDAAHQAPRLICHAGSARKRIAHEKSHQAHRTNSTNRLERDGCWRLTEVKTWLAVGSARRRLERLEGTAQPFQPCERLYVCQRGEYGWHSKASLAWQLWLDRGVFTATADGQCALGFPHPAAHAKGADSLTGMPLRNNFASNAAQKLDDAAKLRGANRGCWMRAGGRQYARERRGCSCAWTRYARVGSLAKRQPMGCNCSRWGGGGHKCRRCLPSTACYALGARRVRTQRSAACAAHPPASQ